MKESLESRRHEQTQRRRAHQHRGFDARISSRPEQDPRKFPPRANVFARREGLIMPTNGNGNGQYRGLTESDLSTFARFGIFPELLDAAHVARVTDREARDLGIQWNGGDCAGIVFPYYNPATGNRCTARVRRDHPKSKTGNLRTNTSPLRTIGSISSSLQESPSCWPMTPFPRSSWKQRSPS